VGPKWAKTAIPEVKKQLPPPYECIGTTRGSHSNATLLLIPTEDMYSGRLVQDQLYRMRLVVRNPLYNPLALGLGPWRLLSRWGSEQGIFLTLHDTQIEGFPVVGMQVSVTPETRAPEAFHIANISFMPLFPDQGPSISLSLSHSLSLPLSLSLSLSHSLSLSLSLSLDGSSAAVVSHLLPDPKAGAGKGAGVQSLPPAHWR